MFPDSLTHILSELPLFTEKCKGSDFSLVETTVIFETVGLLPRPTVGQRRFQNNGAFLPKKDHYL